MQVTRRVAVEYFPALLSLAHLYSKSSIDTRTDRPVATPIFRLQKPRPTTIGKNTLRFPTGIFETQKLEVVYTKVKDLADLKARY